MKREELERCEPSRLPFALRCEKLLYNSDFVSLVHGIDRILMYL